MSDSHPFRMPKEQAYLDAAARSLASNEASAEKVKARLKKKLESQTIGRRKTAKRNASILPRTDPALRTSDDLVPYSPGLPASQFYLTRAWLIARYDIFLRDGRRCACCGQQKGVLHVDHILPRSLHPNLELDRGNLQVLCAQCNIGKGARDSTDWRSGPDPQAVQT